jgi:small-conductance mechanosensitive channel/CRP-like cAMP-binding protein
MASAELKKSFIIFITVSAIIIAALLILFFFRPTIEENLITFARSFSDNVDQYTAISVLIKGLFKVINVILLFALVVAIIRFLNTVIFGTALKKAGSYELTGIIRSIVNILLYIVAFFIIFKTQYPTTDLAALFTTSTIIGVVIGLALQDTLGNLFAGLAMQADQPFQIGDVVNISNKGVGVVENISWRGVKIRTFQNKLLLISNSVLSKEAIEVAPQDGLNAKLVFFNTLYTNPPAKTIKVIREVVRQCSNVSPKIRPKVRIRELGSDGIEWEVKYWLIDYSQYNTTNALIRQNVWYAFQREGIDFAYPTRTVYVQNEQEADVFVESQGEIFARLSNVPVFSPLCEDEIKHLAKASSIRVFAPDEPIVVEDQKGESMFVIHRGAVTISIKENGTTKNVGNLKEGDFFGEMGLFTGEPRTATVTANEETEVLEIGHHCLKPILENNPDLVATISEIIDERKADLDKQQNDLLEKKKDVNSGLVKSIRKFFGLSNFG